MDPKVNMLGVPQERSISDPPGLSLSKLLNVAAAVSELTWANSSHEATATRRLVGRLLRNPKDVDASCQAIVCLAKAGGELSKALLSAPVGFVLLQIAMMNVSFRVWDGMWDEAHVDRVGEGPEGHDVALMAIWRERIRTLISECGQDEILALTCEEYFSHLGGLGVEDEVAEGLAQWLGEVMAEDTTTTPST